MIDPTSKEDPKFKELVKVRQSLGEAKLWGVRGLFCARVAGEGQWVQ